VQIIRRVFGPSFEAACDVLDRMLYASFTVATELRMRYDPHYCSKDQGFDVFDDLRAAGRNRRDRQRAVQFARRARQDLHVLEELLAAARPELLEPANALDLRAVRVAFHTDRGGLKRRILAAVARGAAPEQIVRQCAPAIDRAVASKDATARCLIAVGLHHELTRLQREGYRRLVRALAYTD